MLPKKYRFITRLGEDFFAKAKRIYSPFFILYFKKRIDQETSIAIVVPKKFFPKAVERSFLKRKIKSALILFLPSLKNIDLVFYLKKRVTKEDCLNFNKEIGKLIRKID